MSLMSILNSGPIYPPNGGGGSNVTKGVTLFAISILIGSIASNGEGGLFSNISALVSKDIFVIGELTTVTLKIVGYLLPFILIGISFFIIFINFPPLILAIYPSRFTMTPK